MSRRNQTLATGALLLAATPLLLSLPALTPGIDGLLPFLGGIATGFLGHQFICGDLAEV